MTAARFVVKVPPQMSSKGWCTAYPEDVCYRVHKRRIRQCQVDAEQDVESPLVSWGAPVIDQEVGVGVQSPARSAKKAKEEVDDEAHHCMCSASFLTGGKTVLCALADWSRTVVLRTRRHCKYWAKSECCALVRALLVLQGAVSALTANDKAHRPGQDPVASLAWGHLPQHGHGNGLDVEGKSNGADSRRKGICTPHVTHQAAHG